MPSWNLGELMSQATARAGRRADLSASTVSLWANQAYFDVADAVPHALLERLATSSTTSGENRIDLPGDFGEPINISMEWSWSTSTSRTSSHKTLYPMNASQADAEGFLPAGEPEAYVAFNRWIELWPSPDSAYSLQLRYRSTVTDLVATSDVPSLSTAYRFAVVLKLEQYLHEYNSNWEAAAAAEARYLTRMGTTKTDTARRQLSEQGGRIALCYETPRRT